MFIIMYGVNQFSPNLYKHKFTVVMHNRTLQWLSNLEDPLLKSARWRIFWKHYCTVLLYSILNSYVDALFRMYTIDELNEYYYKTLYK